MISLPPLPNKPPPFVEPPPPSQAGREDDPPNWVRAIATGTLGALGGGILWGVLLGYTAFRPAFLTAIVGVAVVGATWWGARRVTLGVSVLAVGLAGIGVYVVEVVAIAIFLIRAGADVRFLNVVVAYPLLMALGPADLWIAWISGMLGACGVLAYIAAQPDVVPRAPLPWRGTKVWTAPAAPPTARVHARGFTKAAVRVRIPGPPVHSIEASYRLLGTLATVLFDGHIHFRERIWGGPRIVDISLEGWPRAVTFRFRGIIPPRIDVYCYGRFLGTVQPL